MFLISHFYMMVSLWHEIDVWKNMWDMGDMKHTILKDPKQNQQIHGRMTKSCWETSANVYGWFFFSMFFLSNSGVGIDVPKFGDWFKTSPKQISVGNDIPFLVGWCSIGTFTNPCNCYLADLSHNGIFYGIVSSDLGMWKMWFLFIFLMTKPTFGESLSPSLSLSLSSPLSLSLCGCGINVYINIHIYIYVYIHIYIYIIQHNIS